MAFKLKSYIYSREAENRGINNMPGVDVGSDPKLTPEYIIGNLELLHNKVVDPIMRHFNNLEGSSGNSIGVTSVYRCKELNEVVGGVETSQHIQGMACDIIYTEGFASEVYNWAINNLPTWNQIIWEFPEKGQFSSGNTDSEWVHVAYNENDNKKTKSLASEKENLHEYYKNNESSRRGQYTHDLEEEANQLIVFN
tara:strand:+ start:1487 stop:2074 length:588 start_codon:yes stop_codon:yes gene_type:complete